MSIGIYSIFWLQEDLFYIGQSVNIEERLNNHISLLKRKIHHNYKLQKAFDTYGSPEFCLLQECLPSELNLLEIQYIEEFNSIVQGLNIVPGGKSIPGYESPRCIETKEKLIDVFKLVLNPVHTNILISEVTGVSIHTVEAIRYGKRHNWLSEMFPYEYKELHARTNERLVLGQLRRFNKNYPTVLSPDNKEYSIINASAFAKEHNLNRGHFAAVLRGVEKTHKGWKLKEGSVSNE